VNRRILKKRAKRMREFLSEMICRLDERPRHGPMAETCLEVVLILLDVSISLYFHDLRKLQRGSLTHTWISDSTLPELHEPHPDRMELSGTLTYSRQSDDSVVARVRYRLTAERGRRGWDLHIVTVQDGSDLSDPTASRPIGAGLP